MEPSPQPKKRGRPAKNGVKPGWMLLRHVMLVEAYHRARNERQKHEFAIRAARDAAKADFPDMKISDTHVREALRELQPKGSEGVFLVTKVGKKWTLGLGPRPAYKIR